jgi:hypothetical protein
MGLHDSRATGRDDCAEGVVSVPEDRLPVLLHETTQSIRYVDLLLGRVRISAFEGAASPSQLPIVKNLKPIADRSRSFR